jgi:hypothetical protein
MPTIQLSEQVFAELQRLASPPSDTPEALAARLIHEEALRRGVQSEPAPTTQTSQPQKFHIRSPHLAHPEDARMLEKQVLELPPNAHL